MDASLPARASGVSLALPAQEQILAARRTTRQRARRPSVRLLLPAPFELLAMASTKLTFASRDEHRKWLASQAVLPAGFRVGSTRFEFVPVEVRKPAAMNLT